MLIQSVFLILKTLGFIIGRWIYARGNWRIKDAKIYWRNYISNNWEFHKWQGEKWLHHCRDNLCNDTVAIHHSIYCLPLCESQAWLLQAQSSCKKDCEEIWVSSIHLKFCCHGSCMHVLIMQVLITKPMHTNLCKWSEMSDFDIR